MDTVWELLDDDASGAADESELALLFKKMGCPLADEEVVKLMRSIDNKGLTFSRQQFEWAYHTPPWLRVRAMAATKIQMMKLKEKQDSRYLAWAKRERDELGLAGINKETLMRRRGLRRSKPVRIAIGNMWKSMDGARRYLDWVEKDLFVTLTGMIAAWSKVFNPVELSF